MLFKKKYIRERHTYYRQLLRKSSICEECQFESEDKCTETVFNNCSRVSQIFQKIYDKIPDDDLIYNYRPYANQTKNNNR